MQDKTTKKKQRKEVKIHDLKPKKDAKGGVCAGGRTSNTGHFSI